MRRLHRLAGAALLAAGVLLAGCQSQDKRSGRESPRREPPPATGDWLDGPAPADADARPARRTPKPAPRSLDSTGKTALAGLVENPDGRPAVGVSVEYAAADGSDGAGAPLDVLTDDAGRFQIRGLRPDTPYVLTARSRFEGRDCAGRVSTRTGLPKSEQQVIRLDPNLVLPVLPNAPPDPAVVRPTFPGSPRPNAPPDTSIPSPQRLRDTSSLPARASELGTPRPSAAVGERDWSPFAPPAPQTVTPTPTVGRPDLRTDGPTGLDRPPSAAVPGSLPERSESQSVPIRHRSEFVLLDAAGLDREYPTGRANSFVLLEFFSTTCVPCKKAIPTLNALQTRHAARGLEVVGVLCDDVPRDQRRQLAAKYHRENGLKYVVTTEPGPSPGALMERFGATKFPTLVLLNGSGERLWDSISGDAADLERVIVEAGR